MYRLMALVSSMFSTDTAAKTSLDANRSMLNTPVPCTPLVGSTALDTSRHFVQMTHHLVVCMTFITCNQLRLTTLSIWQDTHVLVVLCHLHTVSSMP